MPQTLDQGAAAASKDKQMARMRIVLQRLLDDQSKAVESLAQVSVARRQPYANTAGDLDHCRDNALMMRVSAAPSTSAPTMILSPAPSTISIRPTGPDAATGTRGAVSAVTVTGTIPMGSRIATVPATAIWRRQVNKRLALTP
jgi:hypothetical protein